MSQGYRCQESSHSSTSRRPLSLPTSQLRQLVPTSTISRNLPTRTLDHYASAPGSILHPRFPCWALLSSSSCYLRSTVSSEKRTWKSDPLLPACCCSARNVLSFTRLANICWVPTRCTFLFVISLTKNSEVKNMRHFQNAHHSWSLDWLRIKPFS